MQNKRQIDTGPIVANPTDFHKPPYLGPTCRVGARIAFDVGDGSAISLARANTGAGIGEVVIAQTGIDEVRRQIQITLAPID